MTNDDLEISPYEDAWAWCAALNERVPATEEEIRRRVCGILLDVVDATWAQKMTLGELEDILAILSSELQSRGFGIDDQPDDEEEQ